MNVLRNKFDTLKNANNIPNDLLSILNKTYLKLFLLNGVGEDHFILGKDRKWKYREKDKNKYMLNREDTFASPN